METIVVPRRRNSKQSTTTSLYELIETIQNSVGPEDDDLVVATMMYLLRSGHIRVLHHAEASQCSN